MIGIIGLTSLPSPSEAHSWYSARKDPKTQLGCCGGSDCATLRIEPGVLTAETDGYRIRLTIEQAQRINPNRFEPLDVLIPWQRVQNSEDGNWHICIPRWNDITVGNFYCFFAPPNG